MNSISQTRTLLCLTRYFPRNISRYIAATARSMIDAETELVTHWCKIISPTWPVEMINLIVINFFSFIVNS